ncbi:MAG: RecX family transcriptional regulator, partial [Bacillota bacterium]|nr:RecX family transcriptional regulator [Bacillota bacterium]
MNALERATKYLSFKPRTRAQVYNHLIEKGFEVTEVSEAIRELEEYNYINDVNFSMLYFQLGFDKGHGLGRIKRELYQKGVKREDIEEAISQLDYIPDEFEEAMKIGQRVMEENLGRGDFARDAMEAMDFKDLQKLKAKILRRLASRGY